VGEARGTVKIGQGMVKLTLKDLTGFDGRVDAIVLSDDASFTPDVSMRQKDAGTAREGS
jgi:hypothetical protein